MPTNPPTLLENPQVMWAVHPADLSRIHFIEGMQDAWPKLPQVGDTLTVPFLVDPISRKPIPVLVSEIRPLRYQGKDVLAVMVTRAH